MKSWKKSPLIVMALILLIAIGVLSVKLGTSAAGNQTDSGIPGLQGPQFTLGLVLASGIGNNPSAPSSAQGVLNGAPWALSGYVLNKYTGSVHVWISQCSQVARDLGYKPGDVVQIFCGASQVSGLNVGDFVEFFGFTARGYLVRSGDTVLPAPFSY